MNRSIEQLWSTLSKAGLVEGLPPERSELESPWYVKVLMAFLGWLAALFLLGFVGFGVAAVLESGIGSTLIGGLMIGGAFMLLRAPKKEFLEHFALAVSLAGQALVIWGLFKSGNTQSEILWLTIMLLQAALAVFMPGSVHRVFSSFIACFALSVVLTLAGAPYLASGIILLGAAWLWLNEFRYPKHMLKIRSIGIGLVLAVIKIKGTLLFSYSSIFWLGHRRQIDVLVEPWVGELLTGFVFLFVVWQLLRRFNEQLSTKLLVAGLLSAIVIAAVSFEAPGITIGLVILLLGFAGSHRVLIGLGVASLLFYISAYYYLLDTTLLVKALTLMILAVVLLSCRWLMHHFLTADQGDLQEVQHAN